MYLDCQISLAATQSECLKKDGVSREPSSHGKYQWPQQKSDIFRVLLYDKWIEGSFMKDCLHRSTFRMNEFL